MDTADLLSEYDDLAQTVASSKHQFFADNLKRWLALLDETPELAEVVWKLENTIDFQDWKQSGLDVASGMRPGRINFPDGSDERLGAQIGLFRSLTSEPDAAWRFASEFVSSERKFDYMISDLVDQLFRPFVSDLRRRIRRNLTEETTIPASDRTVTIGDNSAALQHALEIIEELKEAVRAKNDYDDPEEREQRLAEIEAGKSLLGAKRVRLRAIWEATIVGLKKLASKFVDNAIGAFAKKAIAALLKLLELD